jgi:NADH:ubiquinone oxidoreductase subunit K
MLPEEALEACCFASDPPTAVILISVWLLLGTVITFVVRTDNYRYETLPYTLVKAFITVPVSIVAGLALMLAVFASVWWAYCLIMGIPL